MAFSRRAALWARVLPTASTVRFSRLRWPFTSADAGFHDGEQEQVQQRDEQKTAN